MDDLPDEATGDNGKDARFQAVAPGSIAMPDSALWFLQLFSMVAPSDSKVSIHSHTPLCLPLCRLTNPSR
jgi:hypothetical protein